MKPLNQEYLDELALIKTDIQASDILAKYLDEEEEEDYLALREAFEPRISELYKKIAENNPLQLVTLEKELLDDEYEGMYITRILGFAVLRGEINDNYKYVHRSVFRKHRHSISNGCRTCQNTLFLSSPLFFIHLQLYPSSTANCLCSDLYRAVYLQ